MPYTDFTTTTTIPVFHDYEVGDIIRWFHSENEYEVLAIGDIVDRDGDVQYDLRNIRSGLKVGICSAPARYTEKVVKFTPPKPKKIYRYYVDLDIADMARRVQLLDDLNELVECDLLLPDGKRFTYDSTDNMVYRGEV